jgi:membrane protein YqaA with SNARE-associated domain
MVSRYLASLWAGVERFAHARGAVPGTFLWNLGQGSVVPGPAELLLVPLAIADPPRAPRLAAAAWAGSVLGGCVAYAIGALAFDPIARPLLSLLGFGDDTLRTVTSMMARYGWLFILGSTLTPLSTKAIAITAGFTGLPFTAFGASLGVGRLLRFGLVVLLLRASSGPLHRWRERLLTA